EDRKEYGLILMNSVKHNLTMSNLESISNNNILNEGKEIVEAEKLVDSMNIKAPSIEQETVNLSGGNQQKVVIGKWMFTKPNIFINELADAGNSIIMISSELPELLGVCDRIYTLAEGVITGEHLKSETDQEKLMKDMTHVGEEQYG